MSRGLIDLGYLPNNVNENGTKIDSGLTSCKPISNDILKAMLQNFLNVEEGEDYGR